MGIIQRVPWTVQPQFAARPDEQWKSRGLRTLASASARINAVTGALPTSTSGTGWVTSRGRSVEYARANSGDRYAAPHLNVGSSGDGSVLLLWQHSSTAIAGSDRAIANVGTDVTTAGFRIATNGTGSDTVYGQAYNTGATLVSITGPTLVDGQIYCTVLTAGTTLTLYHDGALIGTAAVSGGVRRTASAKTVGPGYLADVNALLFAEFESLLTDQEAFALMRNPWQLFTPLQRTIWVPVSAGGTTYTITPSGGVVFSGTSDLPKGKIFLPTGGVNFAGTGSATFTGGGTTYTISPTGGITFAGAATQVLSKTIAPTGGFSFGGVGVDIETKVIIPSGGVTFGGTGSMSSNTSTTTGPQGERTKVGIGN